MNRLTSYINDLVVLKSEAESYHKELKVKLSEIDKLVSSKYHEIELATFNVVKGYKMLKELQTILRQRRVLKNEIVKTERLMQFVVSPIDLENIEITKNKMKRDDEKLMKYSGNWGITIDDILKQAK